MARILPILDPIFGCLLATGRLDQAGYAYHGRTRSHIAAYTAARGPVSPGLELDHACRRRSCSALHHLEAVTRTENERRKSLAYRLRIALCPRGHDLKANRAMTPEGGVTCRLCNADAILGR